MSSTRSKYYKFPKQKNVPLSPRKLSSILPDHLQKTSKIRDSPRSYGTMKIYLIHFFESLTLSIGTGVDDDVVDDDDDNNRKYNLFSI